MFNTAISRKIITDKLSKFGFVAKYGSWYSLKNNWWLFNQQNCWTLQENVSFKQNKLYCYSKHWIIEEKQFEKIAEILEKKIGDFLLRRNWDN